jgi:hypothetical protein
MIKLENKKIVQFFFLILLFKIINGYVFIYINARFFKLENAIFEKLSESELFFLAVVLAPIIETLIFQLFLYRLLNKIGINNTSVIIILMSFAFSQAHWYHWLYVVAAFINGLLLNYFYVYILKKKNELIAVLITIAFHSCYNLYGFLFVE